MSNTPSFRSAFNGFNRSDVVGFIKGLMDENAGLNNALAELQNELAQKEAQLQAYRSEADARRAELEASRAEAEAYRTQLGDMETERQKLGRAMYDARRFSDILVQEANDKANGMLDSAAQNAKEISDTVDTIVSQTEHFTSYCNDTLGGIREKLEELNRSLFAFTQDVLEKRTDEVTADDFYDADEKAKPRLAVRKVKK